MVANASGIDVTNPKPNKVFQDDASLGITERYFHHIAEDKNQVIMTISFKLKMPPQARHVSETRLVDLLKLAQSKHFRLSSYVDYDTQVGHTFSKTADQLPLLYRFVPTRDPAVWRRVFDEELNAHFDVHDMRFPLWRVAIVGVPELAGAGIPLSPADIEADAPGTSFDILFSFHHCIGDGLSMLAYARSFLAECTAANINAESLHLDQVQVSQTPPPLLDNYIHSSIFSAIPTGFGLWLQSARKKNMHKFKHLLPDISKPLPALPPPASYPTNTFSSGSVVPATGPAVPEISKPSTPLIVQVPQTPSPAPEIAPVAEIAPAVGPAAGTPISVSPEPAAAPAAPAPAAHDLLQEHIKRTFNPYLATQVRFHTFDAAYVGDLLKSTKANGTTVAALLIVNALSSCRATFAPIAEQRKKHLPRHQGWVATTALRHLIPGSKLLYGADKQTDFATMIFGGYSGSISEPRITIDGKSEFWDRCRRVRKTIGSAAFTSMRRNKLFNWVYRHQSLYKALYKMVDLGQMSHGYSCEVANLGAWDYPAAAPNAPASDDRARLEWFGGTLNCSFEGSRALFTLGVITLGSEMSVTIAYDRNVISEELADDFSRIFKESMDKVRANGAGKIKLSDLTGVKA
nr:hypothetical protein HK105_001856 [Polyrhizophydium stewartii]